MRRGALHGERGLFDSGPRFVLIVALLAAVTTGPTAALALAGHAALDSTHAPATTPLVATAPAATSVLVPDSGDEVAVDAGGDPPGPLSTIRFEEHATQPVTDTLDTLVLPHRVE